MLMVRRCLGTAGIEKWTPSVFRTAPHDRHDRPMLDAGPSVPFWPPTLAQTNEPLVGGELVAENDLAKKNSERTVLMLAPVSGVALHDDPFRPVLCPPSPEDRIFPFDQALSPLARP